MTKTYSARFELSLTEAGLTAGPVLFDETLSQERFISYR